MDRVRLLGGSVIRKEIVILIRGLLGFFGFY